MSLLVSRAARFAQLCHLNQTRKYHGSPYFEHVDAVANIVARFNGTDEMIAAAYLHDVIEDCGQTRATIERIFGEKVATLVWWLTTTTTLDMGNRACRKDMDAVRLSHAPGEAQTIKIADMIHNTYDIVQHDPKFARTYLAEKRFALDLMVDANPRIINAARMQLAWASSVLNNS